MEKHSNLPNAQREFLRGYAFAQSNGGAGAGGSVGGGVGPQDLEHTGPRRTPIHTATSRPVEQKAAAFRVNRLPQTASLEHRRKTLSSKTWTRRPMCGSITEQRHERDVERCCP
jgi:hypothetical protein